MKKILLAGLLGGVAMFVWSSLAHMVLPLGSAGISQIPGEQPLIDLMRSTLGTRSGLYFFPAMGKPSGNTTQNELMAEFVKKLAVNPSGLIIYHPPGRTGMTAAQLGFEFGTELVESLLLAFLLSHRRTGQVLTVLVVGLMAAITTNIPYWNWYGFPLTYTAAYMTTEFVAYLVSGLVAVLVLRRGS